jgi:hypothetical protein
MIPDKTNNTQQYHAYAGTDVRMTEVDANGVMTATKTIITGKLADATIISYLVADASWNNLGVYVGTAITGTFEGMYYFAGNYYYVAYSDNVWNRILINKHIELTRYQYFSSTTGDTVGDTRVSNQTGCVQTETCTVANATKGSGTWVVSKCIRTISLTDSNEAEGVGSYFDLASGKSGRGSIVFGDGIGYADFIFTTAGVVTLITYSANVFTSLQTGTNHVIIKDNGSNVRITNELGATTIFTIEIKYTN